MPNLLPIDSHRRPIVRLFRLNENHSCDVTDHSYQTDSMSRFIGSLIGSDGLTCLNGPTRLMWHLCISMALGASSCCVLMKPKSYDNELQHSDIVCAKKGSKTKLSLNLKEQHFTLNISVFGTVSNYLSDHTIYYTADQFHHQAET